MKVKGSKDGQTWEEGQRVNKSGELNRFSEVQTLKNLEIMRDWCEEKILELKSSCQQVEKIEHPSEKK